MNWILQTLFRFGLLQRYWLKCDGKMIYVYGPLIEQFLEEK